MSNRKYYRRAKQSEILAWMVSVQYVKVTFDGYMSNVKLGSLSTFLTFGNLLSEKRLVVDRNRRKFVLWDKYSAHAGYF